MCTFLFCKASPIVEVSLHESIDVLICKRDSTSDRGRNGEIKYQKNGYSHFIDANIFCFLVQSAVFNILSSFQVKVDQFPNFFTIFAQMPHFSLPSLTSAFLTHLPQNPTFVPPTFASLHLSYKLRAWSLRGDSGEESRRLGIWVANTPGAPHRPPSCTSSGFYVFLGFWERPHVWVKRSMRITTLTTMTMRSLRTSRWVSDLYSSF